MIQNKTILITGGTGSFGIEFINYVIKKKIKFKKIIIFSRDELKQWRMKVDFPEHKYPNLRFFLGDIRDKERLERAFNGVDVVIHAAALKQMDTAEYNPDEFIKTNVLGSQNIVECAIKTNVKKVIALSTDKACSPSTLYGATKLCAEKIFLAANNIKGDKETVFLAARYGNVYGSRGSLIPLLEKLNRNNNKTFTLTDKEATRFFITYNDAIKLVFDAINNFDFGLVLVPKLKSIKIIEIVKTLYPNIKIKIGTLRPGEKISEKLISSDENIVYDLGKYYGIIPIHITVSKNFKKNNKFIALKNFSLDSGDKRLKLDTNKMLKYFEK